MSGTPLDNTRTPGWSIQAADHRGMHAGLDRLKLQPILLRQSDSSEDWYTHL